MSAYNEARKRATENYMAKKSRVHLVMDPEDKKAIEEKAKQAGKSLNAYIIDKALGRE